MNWSTRHGRGRESYHHGNLKEALIDAALALTAANGPLGFTFAEAARQAGVSPAAPYRHFPDREHLIAAVAERGFARFEAALAAAWGGGGPNAMAAFTRMGKAYLDFARAEPGYYAAMFEANLQLPATPELTRASEAAFAVLRGAADVVAAGFPDGKRPPAMMIALHVWSLAHGVASLFARGNAMARLPPMSPDDLLEAGVLVYLAGLGIGPAK
jgi:AcrR family transcriptional regulator